MFMIFKSIVPKNRFWDLYNSKEVTLHFFKNVKNKIDLDEEISEIENNWFYNVFKETENGMKFICSNWSPDDNPQK